MIIIINYRDFLTSIYLFVILETTINNVKLSTISIIKKISEKTFLFMELQRYKKNQIGVCSNMRLKDQVSIVTGGGRGIGRAIALAFAKEGADVAVIARTQSEIESVAQEINDFGGKAIAIKTDVTDESQVERMVKTVIDRFGKIDTLVNNAGYAKHAYIQDISNDLWDTTMNINLRGIMLCTRAVYKYMLEQKNGYIINISSGAGKHGSSQYATYSTSKFGVIGFTESLSSEGRRHGIKASVICPGPVATKMRASNHPDDDISKLMQPEDIADVAVFLVTQPQRAYIQEVVVSAFLF
ncbi:TPA: SDR family oxidoreductase [bacterium]|nr:SDR family oxidoreductase [bacterium]